MNLSTDRNQSGSRIRMARHLRTPYLTQDYLSAKLQVRYGIILTKNIISRIENGQRYVTDLELLAFADVLKVSVAWLLGVTNDPTPDQKGGLLAGWTGR